MLCSSWPAHTSGDFTNLKLHSFAPPFSSTIPETSFPMTQMWLPVHYSRSQPDNLDFCLM